VQRACAPAQHGEQLSCVVAVEVHTLILWWTIEDAARVAARVVTHHRISVAQQSSQRCKDASIGRAAGDHQQHRAGTLNLVVDLCALDLEQRRLDIRCRRGHDEISLR
jgi:hypothetical protein